MDIPYTTIFVALLVVYLVYSVWARLDGRYPIAAALALLVVTAVVDAVGDVNAANQLAEFVFFLLAGGVVLLLIEHVRDRPKAADSSGVASGSPSAQSGATDASEGRQGTAEHSLDGLEEQPVPLVDRTGDEYDDDEEEDDSYREDGEGPERDDWVEDP